MKLARATFLGVQGLADATYDLMSGTGRPHDVVALTGPSGCGKTSFLEAVLFAKESVGSYGGLIDSDRWVESRNEAAKISLSFFLNPEERAFAGVDSDLVHIEVIVRNDEVSFDADDGVQALLERYSHVGTEGKFEYFPSNRTLLPYGPPHGTDEGEQRLLRCTSDLRKYSAVPTFLLELRRDRGRAEYFQTVLRYLNRQLQLAEPPSADRPWQCLWKGKGGALGPDELSDSERDAVIIASTAAMTQLSNSIVLCDRPDLYVAPDLATAYASALAALGTDNQLILATTSREILGAMDPSQILSLSARP